MRAVAIYSYSSYDSAPAFGIMADCESNNMKGDINASSTPFVSAQHRPAVADGRFRVVLITSGSVASVKLPLIAAELIKVSP